MAVEIEGLFFKLSKIQRYLIVSAIAVLMLVAFYLLIVMDLQADVENREKEISSLNVQIESQKAILAKGPQLKKDIEALEVKLKTMVNSLPEKQDIDVLLKNITDLLSETNLEAKRFVPGQESIDEELYYAKIPITLNTRGDYQKQGTFLMFLNDLPRIVNVPNIKLSKSGALTGRESDLAKKLDLIALDADIVGETYRRLTAEEIQRISAKKSAKPGRK